MERAAACRVTDLNEAEIVLMLGIIMPVDNGLWSWGVYTSMSKEQMRVWIDAYEGGLGSWNIRSVTAVLYQILLFDLRSKYETREVGARGLVIAWEGRSADLNTCQPYFTGDVVLTPAGRAHWRLGREESTKSRERIHLYRQLRLMHRRIHTSTDSPVFEVQ